MISERTYRGEMDHIIASSGKWYYSRCTKAHLPFHALRLVLKYED